MSGFRGRQPRMAKPVAPSRLREIMSNDQLPTPATVDEEPEVHEPQPEGVESIPSMDMADEDPAAARADEESQSPDHDQAEPSHPQTVREMFDRVDEGWRRFRAAAGAFPSERMDEHLNEGWTRKQMLAHIAAWHDLTHDRLGTMLLTGRPSDRIEDTDKFNARVARQAIGRTAGEVLKEMEMTFNRLRRQLGRMTDQQLVADDGWAAHVIATNTYEHYEEHAADVYQPPPPDTRSGRR